MEAKTISMDYPGGHMNVNLQYFFPAEDKRIRGLFRLVINQVFDSSERNQICDEMEHYLDDNIEKYSDEATLKLYANTYADYITKVKELQEPIDKQKEKVARIKFEMKQYPARSPQKKMLKTRLEKEQSTLKDLRDSQSAAKLTANLAKNAFNDSTRLVKQLARNRKLVQELTDHGR